MNAEKFMNVVRRHTGFEELTPTLLREFVEKIVVHECSYDENKTRSRVGVSSSKLVCRRTTFINFSAFTVASCALENSAWIGFVFSHGTPPFFDYGKMRQHFLLSPLDTHQQGQAGLSTVGAVHLLAVDWLGRLCYTHLFLSMLLSHLNISYIIWNGHERHIQIFCCNL